MKTKKIGILKLLYFVYNKYYSKGRFKIYAWLYMLFKFLQEIYPLALSFLSAKIIDDVISVIGNNGTLNDVLPLMLWFGILLLFWVIVSNGYALMDSIIYLWLSYQDDDIYLKKYAQIEPQAYENSKFIGQKNVLAWNSQAVFNSIITTLESITTFATVIVAFIAISGQNYLFAIIAILAAIPGGIVTSKFGKKIWNIWSSESEEKAKYSNYRWPLWETKFESIQELYVFGYGKYLIKRAKEINKIFTLKLERNNITRQVWLTLASLWRNLFFLIVVLYSIKLAIDGNITIGSLTFIIAAYQQFNDRVGDLIYDISYVTGNRKVLESFYKIMHRENKIKSGGVILPDIQNGVSIEFKNVSFKYPNTDKWIFKDLNFKITSDEDLAIVGKNGAGKTTLIKLILRIYDPNKGEIIINGINLKDLNINSYHKSVGVLTQSFNRLGITVRDNIHIGNVKNRDSNQIKEAARLADVDTMISELPKGYDTYLTKDINEGFQLSGGQWQKIAIARAFYRKSKLLILDEPTSAVDAISEEKIFDNIRSNAQNQTTLIVSHRFSTVKKAKKIIVIDNGEIVEQGEHKQLINNKGLYFEMYTKQSSK